MGEPLKNRKILYDPLWGLIDITEYLPMIDVPQFQALGFKYQLGITSLLFPAATHTRKQHSFGAFKRTQELADRWLHRGFIDRDEARLIVGYALWHDIGHGPFSHVIEEVTKELWGRNHDENGARIIEELKPAVAACGIRFEDLRRLFRHEDPLYLAVHDKNLGTEKLDYLSRDAYYTLGETPGTEYLAEHTYFLDGGLAIDEKAIDNAKALQEFYVRMYKTVYLRKNSAIAQRMVQKMALELIRSEQIDEETFWAFTDFGLLGRFEMAREELVREYYARFTRRDLPRTAIAIRLEQFSSMEKQQQKAQTTLGIPESQMRALIDSDRMRKPSVLGEVEEEIARIAKLPKNSVLIVPPVSIERFTPQDITIALSDGTTAKLSDYFADHFRALEEEGKSYVVLRICTFEEHREKLSAPSTAEAIRAYLLSLIAA